VPRLVDTFLKHQDQFKIRNEDAESPDQPRPRT
jgi:hypothetical protein